MHDQSSSSGFCCGFHRGEYLRRQTALGAERAASIGGAPASSFSSAASPSLTGDPIFSIDAPSIRFGRGALLELGSACASLRMKRIMLLTDKNVARTEWYAEAVKGLKAEGIDVVQYHDVSIEPTLKSMMHASAFATDAKVDGFVSIGGGSVIDTAKAANLYSCHPSADPLVYVNAPIGLGRWPGAVKPHVACPTTAGTGSECTGIAIFDHEEMGVKTGIAHRGLRPTLAIVDPITQDSVPATVCAASGFDVLSHALESYTARPHHRRPSASTPKERFAQRPMSQGKNIWADEGCLSALRMLGESILPAVEGDREARETMMLASTMAGIAFGNVGVHLPHAMSYAVSGGVREFKARDYSITEGPIVPHGMSVILNAPSVFRYTAQFAPRVHHDAARALGVPSITSGKLSSSAPGEEIGQALAEHLVDLMRKTKMPRGLQEVGYSESDIPQLVSGTMKQQRLLNNLDQKIGEKEMKGIFEGAMKYW
jgi:hydroxyacid-oxoacid transhydrogenase